MKNFLKPFQTFIYPSEKSQTAEIKRLSKIHCIKKYTINNDMSIDVRGGVDFCGQHLSDLPLPFNKINGNFDCSWNYLTSLKGFPRYVTGNIDLNHAMLDNRRINISCINCDGKIYSFYFWRF